jgi:hypothetical protein
MVLTGMLIGKENFRSDLEGHASKCRSYKNDQHERPNCMGGDVQDVQDVQVGIRRALARMDQSK